MDKLGNLLRMNSIAKISELLAVFLVAFVIIKLFLRPDDDHLLYNQGVVWMANIAMLLLVWLGLKLRGESWQDFGLGFEQISFKAALRVFLLSLLVLATAVFVIDSIIMANITRIPESADMSNYAYMKDNIGMLIQPLLS